MRTKTMRKALLLKNLYPFPHKRKFAVSNVMENPKWNKRAQLKAAYALNLCAVSLSKIIDYANVDVLRSEYDAILNNLNIGNIIKDEPLLDAFKKILDTCHFFILHAKDKEMLKKKQDARLKGALTQALGGGNVIAFFGSTNPWAIAAGAVAMLGVAAVNYKAQRDKAKLDNEIEAWELEKSALEQLHNLRRQLFETAWRLSDAYRFPDEYRLTEVQIKDYTDILQDDDPLNRYERLSLIKDYFQAYPLFWYYLGRAALECAECYCENAGDGDQKHHEGDLCDKQKNARKNLNGFVEEAKKAYSKFKELHNGNSLFRVDLVAASAYLDIAQLRNLEKEDSVFGSTDAIFEDIQNAQKLSGTDTDVMQACAFRYLELLDRYSSVENKSKTDECFKRAEYCLKFLLSRDVSVAINGRVLSYLYIKMSDLYKERNESASGEGVCRSYGILKACTSRKCSFVYQRMYPWDKKSFNDDCYKYFNGAGLRRTAFNYFYALIWLANSEFLCALDQAKAERSYAPLKALRDRRASDKLPSTKELLNAIINDAIKINNDISLSISSSQKMISDFVKNRWMNVGDNGDCETGYEVLTEIEKKFLDDSSQRIWYTLGFGTRVSDFGPDEDFQKDEAKLMNKIKDQAKKAAEAFVDEFRGRFREYSNEYHFSEDCNSSSEPDSDIIKISMNDLDSLKKIKSEPQAIKDILFLEEEAERLRLRIQEMLSSKNRFWFPDSGFEDDSSQIQTLVLYHQDNQAVVKTINKTPIWNRIIQPVITQINTIFSSKGKNKEA